MNHPDNLLYSESHEWIEKMGNGNVRIGLSDFAQSELGDIVFVTLPEEGDTIITDESFAEVESVKAVSEVYSPVDGEVIAVNTALDDMPELINQDCYDAWLVEVKVAVIPENLMTSAEYEDFIAKEG